MIKLKHLLPECSECGRDWNHGHDHEAGMAKNELRDMISNASKIDSMVGEGDNLPGWVSAYISLAADYMHSVAEYLGGESSRMDEPGPGYGIEEAKKGMSFRDPEFKKVAIPVMNDMLEDCLDNYDGDFDTWAEYGMSHPPMNVQDGLAKLEQMSSDEEVEKFIQAAYRQIKKHLEKDLNEKKKPSAGLTKAQKSSVAKKAAAGKDIGKKGKGFEKVAKAAEKQYGSKEAGERVAAASMWKNIKRK